VTPLIPEDGQRTGVDNCDLGGDELQFPQCPASIHTELGHYDRRLLDGKGGVVTWGGGGVKEVLTRSTVMATFL